MSNDTFDPESYLGSTFTDPTDTKRIPCPVGEYAGVAGKPNVRLWESEKNGGSAGVAYSVPWEINDDGAKAATGRDKVIVFQDFMFTFYPGTQEIDKEKAKTNIAFGKFRDAIGLNDTEFSWMMVEGRFAKVKVEHEIYKGEPKDKVTACTGM